MGWMRNTENGARDVLQGDAIGSELRGRVNAAAGRAIGAVALKAAAVGGAVFVGVKLLRRVL